MQAFTVIRDRVLAATAFHQMPEFSRRLARQMARHDDWTPQRIRCFMARLKHGVEMEAFTALVLTSKEANLKSDKAAMMRAIKEYLDDCEATAAQAAERRRAEDSRARAEERERRLNAQQPKKLLRCQACEQETQHIISFFQGAQQGSAGGKCVEKRRTVCQECHLVTTES